MDGSPAVTFFAPTNRAFASLPGKLKFFLFSPLGERVLKKLLEFHIVPELVLHAGESVPRTNPQSLSNIHIQTTCTTHPSLMLPPCAVHGRRIWTGTSLGVWPARTTVTTS